MTSNRDLERFEQATETLRDLIREANTAAKDLRNTMREARTLTRDTITADLDSRLRDLGERLQQEMDAGVHRILAEHQKLGDQLMQRDRRSRAQGNEPLEVIVAAAAAGITPEPVQATVTTDSDVLDVFPGGAS